MHAGNQPAQPQPAAHPAPIPAGGPNADPLNLFPQVDSLFYVFILVLWGNGWDELF